MITILTLRRDFDFVCHWNVHVICYLLHSECVCLRRFSVFFWISGCESQSFGKHPNNLINTSLQALQVLHFVTLLQQIINSRSIMSIQHSSQHNTLGFHCPWLSPGSQWLVWKGTDGPEYEHLLHMTLIFCLQNVAGLIWTTESLVVRMHRQEIGPGRPAWPLGAFISVEGP